MRDRGVAIACGAGDDGPVLLDQALALLRTRDRLKATITAAVAARGECRAMVVPAMDAFARGSPAAADPVLVEHLIDHLFDLGVTEAAVGATAGTASLWFENRDVFMTADLLGYRYETAQGRPYDVIDLAEGAQAHPFPSGAALADCGLARAWLEADLRVLMSGNRTDEDDGYALCLSTLLGVLPAVDKDYQYRRRRDCGAVILELLGAAPVHLAIVDAVVSSHGLGGARAPSAIRTDCIIAASDPVLADYVGALKMGLDPYVSSLASPSLRHMGGVARAEIIGPLETYPDWINVDAVRLASTASRRGSATADRSIRPVLQEVDRSIFPFRSPANDWLNNALAQVIAAGDSAEGGGGLLSVINHWLGEMGKAGDAWAVMFNKDGLDRREAPINIDAAAISPGAYRALAAELAGQAETLSGVTADVDGVRWRFDDGAVVFDGARRIALPFARFTKAVEIHRTIQFMNDYIGGQALVTARDRRGRVIRQIERNLYLPQPNYTALGGGVTIDVTKIESVTYGPRRQRMFWKTVRSENDSAIADDGVVTFEALGEDTLVTIWGRQHFRLPPLWAAIDQTLSAPVKRVLVSEAYGRFFQRTFANLEAVAEGREVRIGKPPRSPEAPAPLPIERLADFAQRLQGGESLDLSRLMKGVVAPEREGRPRPIRVDPDGFHHFQGEFATATSESPVRSGLSAIWRDLSHAARIDAGAP